MNSTLGLIALGVVAMCLVLAWPTGDAQSTCETTHSREVCFLALNP